MWIVRSNDYPDDQTLTLYEDHFLARHHVEELGGHVEEITISRENPPEVTDPVKKEKRVREAATNCELDERRLAQQKVDDEHTFARTLEDEAGRGKPILCYCSVFNPDIYFITPNGLCRYCGGWEPATFLRVMGESIFISRVAELNAHHRAAMSKKLQSLKAQGSPER